MREKNEEWKWIKGYEGLYKISSYGRMRSYLKDSKGYVRSNVNQNGWYFTVNIRNKDGIYKTHRIHRLVAENFIGPIPEGCHVHHIDGDKQNNMVSNLQIVPAHDHLSNNAKEHPEMYFKMNEYNMYGKPKTIYMYALDGKYIGSFPNATFAEIATGVCRRNILQVASGDEFIKGHARKQAGGYVWSFEKPKYLD